MALLLPPSPAPTSAITLRGPRTQPRRLTSQVGGRGRGSGQGRARGSDDPWARGSDPSHPTQLVLSHRELARNTHGHHSQRRPTSLSAAVSRNKWKLNEACVFCERVLCVEEIRPLAYYYCNAPTGQNKPNRRRDPELITRIGDSGQRTRQLNI